MGIFLYETLSVLIERLQIVMGLLSIALFSLSYKRIILKNLFFKALN